jgi:hypothetical protein
METGKLDNRAEFVPRRNWDDQLAENLSLTLRKCIEAEQKTRGTRDEKLTAARDRFYQGDIADELD